ncbi:MAG: sensor histidine kinase [Bdellovibrio sp.]|nr:sensor histidine kinase [Bdellovibrio sp.]
MTGTLTNTTLEKYFRNQAIRWGLIGLALTLLFATPCVLYSAKTASERQILYTAKSVARAFRPMILQENIRDAEFQIRKALDLKPGESATIFDSSLKAIFPLKEENRNPHCKSVSQFCWGNHFRTLSILQPIFFDDHKEEGLFGYLELSLTPTVDLSILSTLVVLLLMTFVVQAFGLSSALSQSAQQIIAQLSLWATHLKNTPSKLPQARAKVPFSDLKSMQEAVDGLYIEIEKLRRKAAKDAKIAAQVAILREIGHDLKTPHSLLAKYFAVLVDTVSTTGKLNNAEVENVQRTLKRMGDLLRQILVFSLGNGGFPGVTSGPSKTISILEETQSILNDFRNDSEVLEKGIEIALSEEGILPNAFISQVGYYRILENLLRNAIEGITHEHGHVSINLRTTGKTPLLTVQDNGIGIPSEILPQVFDFEFTTKPERGTGLGLGIVRNTCSQFGAEITVESSIETGTKITVLFQPSPFSIENSQEEGDANAKI